jgi:hypothetical protein
VLDIEQVARSESAARGEEENQRLKKLVADLSLDKEMLQDVIRGEI